MFGKGGILSDEDEDLEGDEALFNTPSLSKRARKSKGTTLAADEANPVFHPIWISVPYTKPNGDEMLSVAILLPSGYYGAELDGEYSLTLEQDKLQLCLVMPRIFEDKILFSDLINDDPDASGYLGTALKDTIKSFHKNSKGGIVWSAEIDLPHTPARDDFELIKVKQKTTGVAVLIAHLVMVKYSDGTTIRKNDIEI